MGRIAILAFSVVLLLLQNISAISTAAGSTNNLEMPGKFEISRPELTTLWEIPADSPHMGNPARINDGSVVFTKEKSLTLVNVSKGIVVWNALLDRVPAWQTTASSSHAYCFYPNEVSAHYLSNGKPAWRKAFDTSLTAHPCLGEGMLVLAFSKTLVCIEAASGKEVWRRDLKGMVSQKPCMVDGSVYVSTSNGFLSCLNLGDGAVSWESNTGDGATCMLVGSDKHIYMVSENVLYAFDRKTGKPLWKFLAKGNGLPPSESKGRVFFPSADKTVYLIDANTASKGCCMAVGKQLWSLYLGTECASQPTVAGTDFLMPTSDGTVHLIGIESGDVLLRIKTGFDLSKALVLPNQLVAQNGRVLAGIAQMPDSIKLYIDKPVLSRNGLNIAINTGAKLISGNSMIPAKHALEPFGGTVAWSQKEKSITCLYQGRKLVMRIGDGKASIDGRSVSIDGASPEVISGRVFVPARFLAEKFMGMDVAWNAGEKSFELTKRGR